jgi:hypothetical protein
VEQHSRRASVLLWLPLWDLPQNWEKDEKESENLVQFTTGRQNLLDENGSKIQTGPKTVTSMTSSTTQHAGVDLALVLSKMFTTSAATQVTS